MTTPIPSWFTAWLRGNDVGTSSMTLGFVLLDAHGLLRDVTAPRDTSDVGRCVRLLDLAAKNGCDWRARLPEVAAAVPEWSPLVPRWGDIEAAYREDAAAQTAAREAWAKQSRQRRRMGSVRLPPSRCWWLVATLRNNGDPYATLDPHPFK